ncbi:MAG: MaoC family dehydratase [Dehalococcoidia bacterium]|nr:MAG: MaoC family dehydratase [Dehalococcoidia bacterium]
MNKAIEALDKGHQFSGTSFVLDEETVARYLEAVEDEALLRLAQAVGKAWVPPMAVAALALRSLMEEMTLPAGAIHGSQEFEFLRALEVGERITCRAWLSHRSQRAGWWILAVGMEGTDESGQPVLTGRLTVMVPR